LTTLNLDLRFSPMYITFQKREFTGKWSKVDISRRNNKG
jgi:hypothetical protein